MSACPYFHRSRQVRRRSTHFRDQAPAGCRLVLQQVRDQSLGIGALELAELQVRDMAGAVDQDRIRQDTQVISIGSGHRYRLVHADQERIIELDPEAPCKRRDLSIAIDGNADELQSLRAVSLLEINKQRDLSSARAAPTGPKIQRDDPSVPLGDVVPEPESIREAERRAQGAHQSFLTNPFFRSLRVQMLAVVPIERERPDPKD